MKTGELAPCEFINVESEFAAMSVAIALPRPVPAPSPPLPAKDFCS